MATYKEWNETLYRYFFNDVSIQDTIFICVDSNVIDYIGKKQLNIPGSAIDDFCTCVLQQILEKNNGEYRFYNKIKINNNVPIPLQTAIIAFFIFVASKMEENPVYRASNYWSVFDDIVKKYYSSYDNTRQTPHYDCWFSLFNNFKNIINNQYDIKFDFPSLFERKNARDFIGLPIFQSMLSAKDRCILTQKFYEYKNKYGIINPDEIVKGDDYSNVFRKIRDSEDYKKYLIKRIDDIAKTWDGCVYEYDSIKRARKNSIIPLVYEYKIDSNGVITFYITTKNADLNISFEDYQLNSEHPRARFPKEKVKLQEDSYLIPNMNIRIARPSTKYILFKKDPETNLYTEVIGNSKVFVGDTFSIIAPVDFFNNDIQKDLLENIISSYDEQNSGYINDDLDLYVLHGAMAGNNDDQIVYITKKDKITMHKGLQSGFKTPNSYIKGAEPVIKIEDLKFVTIDEMKYYIEPKTNKDEDVYFREFDIRKIHNNYGKHSIKLENITKPELYEIIDIKNMPKADEPVEYIYHVISDDIRKLKIVSEDSRSVIGACLNNIEDIEDIVDEKVYKNNKILYILKILEQHNNEKQFPMPTHLRNMVSELISNSPEFDTYIDNNLYIDNYIYKYLSKLKEV